MESGEVFAEYDKRMQDPEYRARMERTAPLTDAEEAEMYVALDELAGDEGDASDSEPAG